jgi:hypothetical protein
VQRVRPAVDEGHPRGERHCLKVRFVFASPLIWQCVIFGFERSQFLLLQSYPESGQFEQYRDRSQ